MSPASKQIPVALARVRKKLPPPSIVLKSKRKDSRKRSKEKLQRELEDFLPRHSR